jgi:hypothetical protein
VIQPARRVAAFTLAALLAAAGLTACGEDDDTLTPSARGPANVSGQSTCVYIEVPAECQDSGVPAERWFKAPAEQPALAGNAQHRDESTDFLYQLFMFHVIYSAFFDSPYYVDRYVPAASRTVFVQHNTTFNNTYRAQEQQNRGRATYRTRSGKTVPGSKADPKKFAPPKNSGGDRGKTCNVIALDLAGQLRAPKPPAPRPARPAPKAPKPANKGVGGDRGNGGKAQHGC